ncbi:MAG TPA: endolytic transglycosylase MltG, partial [Bdellovibrio sp.]|nr:endolytic transglycosylase MltG [Bdellovibrio sp.]
ASIIEKETGAPEERPLISSIFHNRLDKKMKLQTDPTIIYGKAEKTGKIVINITRADLTTPTRYNTYVIDGLPPTPIANPGREALLAAVKPAHSNYLFFVSKNDGTHIFSEDYKAHEKAVRSFQINAKAREGHSWRELKNREKPASASKK